MKERLRLILILLTFAGLSIAVILGSWLYGSYNQRIENLISTTERILFNAVQEYIQDREQYTDTTFRNPFAGPGALLKKNLTDEISKVSPNLSDDTLSMMVARISSRVFPNRITSGNDSGMRFMPPPPSRPLSKHSSVFDPRSGKSTRRILPGFLFSRYSFDSTSYKEICEKFTKELQLNGIKASFGFDIISIQPDSFFTLEGQDMLLPNDRQRDHFQAGTESGLKIRPLLIDAEEGRFISVTLNQSWPFMLYSLSWQLVVSVVLVTTIVGCFIYLFYTIFRQNKLAMLKKEFVNNLTHELRTPVATVYAAIQGLQSTTAGIDSEKKTFFLDIARAELMHLSDMIDDVLDFAEGDNIGNQQLLFEYVNFALIISTCISKVKISKREVHIAFDFDQLHHDETVFGNRAHLENVVTNLLDNAIKYGSNNIKITFSNAMDSPFAELIIADDGEGIPLAYHSQVFEPFFRVPKGDIHEVKGFGLGLSYVKQVVNQHGGSIKLKSRIGQGSAFILTIPRKQNND